MRDYSVGRLTKVTGKLCPVPQATPFLFPDISSFGKTSEEMTQYLQEEAEVIVQNGADFGPPGEGHIRINFATSISVLKEAFERIEQAMMKIGSL
jgi:aspartate/methionine/tyrosine aminotransferase